MSDGPMTHCSACVAQLTEGAAFCAQCGFPVGPREMEPEEAGAPAAAPNQVPPPQEKPPPIRPPSPMRQFAIGLGITAAVLTFLPLDGLFDTADGPYATEPSSTRAPAQPQAPARREPPPPRVEPPSDEEPPPAAGRKAPAAAKAPKLSPATTDGFKVPSFPPIKAQAPPRTT